MLESKFPEQIKLEIGKTNQQGYSVKILKT